MFRSRTRILVPPLAIALMALAGCAGVAANAGSTSPNGLQKTTLNVAAVPAVDSAGFFVALHEGLFAKQGLTIHYSPAVSSDTAIAQQLAGNFDITGGNYVSYIQHYVDDHQPLEIIAEGSVMQQGTQAIYTMPNSQIKTLTELKGHLLGINAPLNINYLLAASVLTENGIKLTQVRFPAAPIPFPIMAKELAAGQIDAAAMPEPFATAAEQQYGAVQLADLNQGATELFPIQGYVVTKSWAEQNPGTLKAFVTALSQGQQIADTSRAAVEQAMETINGGPPKGEIPPIVASVMAVNIYPTAIDEVRIQRVADVMYQFGLLHSRFNVTPMIGPLPAPQGEGTPPFCMKIFIIQNGGVLSLPRTPPPRCSPVLNPGMAVQGKSWSDSEQP
jgi:NitT/TauT family transport system substrate-binding protein